MVEKLQIAFAIFVINTDFHHLFLQGMLSLVEDDKLTLEEQLEELENEKRDLVKQLHEAKESIKDKEMELEEAQSRVCYFTACYL